MLPNFTWDLDPVLAELGPLSLRYYSLLFVFVFLGGYWLLNWQIRRGGGDEEDAGDFIVYGVIGVLGGARIGHVLFYDLDKALRDPFWVFKIWTGGLASHGAVVGLIVAMYLFTRSRGVAFLEGSDRFAFSAALGATLVRIGNFFNSEIVGIPTDQTWGVRFPRHDQGVLEVPLRHPTQLYETAIGLFVMGCLYVADRAWGREKRPRGALIALFFATYFPLRFAVEFVKEHQVFMAETFDMGHYLSIPGALIGFYGLWWAFKRRLPVGWVSRDAYAGLLDDGEHDPDVDAEFDERDRRRRADAGAPAAPRKKKKKKKSKKQKAAGAAAGAAGASLVDDGDVDAGYDPDAEPGVSEDSSSSDSSSSDSSSSDSSSSDSSSSDGGSSGSSSD